MFHRSVLVLSLMFAAAVAQEPHFRVSVNLVQVDAVVTDSKGKHVRDLEAADFKIFEDGRLQKITNFTWVENSTAPLTGSVSGPAPRNLSKSDAGRSIVLMFDDSYRHAEDDLVQVFPAVRNFITGQLGPHDLAAVTASRGGMGFYQQFTNDKRQLLAAVDRLAHRPGFGMWTLDVPLVQNRDSGALEPAFAMKAGEPGLGYRDGTAPNPIGYLMWAIRGLQDVPGRKAVVLFSHSFAAPPALIDLAHRAGVVIHVIDTHGFIDPNTHAFTGLVPSTAPHRQLAKQTGGLFLLSAPGTALLTDLGKVLEDMSGYYLIGYRPERGEAELVQGKPAHHEIHVKVIRPGLVVRARNGYVGVPDDGPRTAPKTSAEYLSEAISSPFRAGRIRVGLEPRYRASAPDPKTLRRGALLEVVMPIDGRDLQLAPREDGTQGLVYSALVVVEGQEGAPAANEGRTFSFRLNAEQSAALANSGVRPSLDLRLPAPGSYLVRVAVRDETSGEVGSAYTFVQVPDFNRNSITLASIELTNRPDRWDAASPPTFRAREPLYFRCGVFGFRTGRKDANVEVQVLLFREEERKPYSDTRKVTVPAESLAEHAVGGLLDLTGLSPGEYILQLVAWDRAMGKQAAQWVRLAIR